jgi:hypothetical protein
MPESNGKTNGEFKGPVCLDIRGTKDIALFERALRDRFDIPEAVRKEAPNKMRELLKSSKTSERGKIMATRVLAVLDKMNFEAAKLALQVAGLLKSDSGGNTTTNQQINIYIPSNGRGPNEQQRDLPHYPSTNGKGVHR